MSEKIEVNEEIKKEEEELSAYTLTPNSCMEFGIILELGSIGAGHAATSLSDVLQQQVLIDVPKIHNIPVHQIPNFYQRHDSPTTAIYMKLVEESECDILLMFGAEEAKKIAALMAMVPSTDDLDPSLKQSAIEELANILIGSFLSAISDFTAIKLIPAPPQWIEDGFDAIIDNFLIKQAMVSNQALVFDTNFRTFDGSANAVLMIFPSPELQKMLIQKSQELCEIPAKSDEPKIIYPEDSVSNVTEIQE
jgi:chemotaxis protein CheC